ncbi:diaminohydroxyphosphoribosylaminopyrimidine deaminase/5-amino-6-(5-phosphoribosylamino)uracil reductase [Aureibacter tunicatorum]|uniref:Riboflavin biosynthesis protein RibD n=2 Tax=Aureibacter tunicatorum TaxID=866807 RepID=A0AAE3XQK8_9BACT|nr:diaminohydroxyphosphoribosylaminopyrimidine deaminase/5-amino-6-(5-phosphoribosylamino)uracil reductase [Aureibacter tunicatorum]BDD05895.1 riboflavin biosynthesis protein RibD [Aureibacter tunicatorum]
MKRALELAQLGLGTTSPNPMVGCVIVHQDKIIGEGWHFQSGKPHAEVNAIASVKDKSLLKESTAYVTLEPCSHYGKTPPCADLLIQHKVKKVVVANLDTNPLVSGRGIKKMKDAGIIVEHGILDQEARQLNKRFFCFHENERPYIILKWAQTYDGFIARKNYDSKWISNSLSRKLVHKWRSEEDAIMVATNTAHYDNPSLNVRTWNGKNPTRIVLDKHLRLHPELTLFDQNQMTICYNLHQDHSKSMLEFVKVDENNLIDDIFKDLHSRKVQSIIIEGGAFLLQSLIEEGLWDEARVFKSPAMFEDGIKAPNIQGSIISQSQIDNDELNIILNKKSIN